MYAHYSVCACRGSPFGCKESAKCVHVRVYTYMYINPAGSHSRTHAHIHTPHSHAHAHTYTHICTHAHAHTQLKKCRSDCETQGIQYFRFSPQLNEKIESSKTDVNRPVAMIVHTQRKTHNYRSFVSYSSTVDDDDDDNEYD